MKRKERSSDDFDNQTPDLKKVKVDENVSEDLNSVLQHRQQEQGDESGTYHQFSNVTTDPHAQNAGMYLGDYGNFDQTGYTPQQLAYMQSYPNYPLHAATTGTVMATGTEENSEFSQIYPNTGYPYVMYTSNGKYEPVIIYYDQDGTPRIQPAPELQEAIHYHGYPLQDIYDPHDISRKKSSGMPDNQEKASVTELAKRIGLLKNEHKEWRFRDQKRTLLLKLTTAHQTFIEGNDPDKILFSRLPHKITPTEFAKRIWLLVFHTIVAEGTVPKFWDRVTDREYLENQLDDEFKSLRNQQFANDVYNALTKHECSIQEAINSVAFRHPHQIDHYAAQHEYTTAHHQESEQVQGDHSIHFTGAE